MNVHKVNINITNTDKDTEHLYAFLIIHSFQEVTTINLMVSFAYPHDLYTWDHIVCFCGFPVCFGFGILASFINFVLILAMLLHVAVVQSSSLLSSVSLCLCSLSILGLMGI